MRDDEMDKRDDVDMILDDWGRKISRLHFF